jgi:hypothetical protein
MAQRKRVQKAKRMHPTLVLQILLHLPLNRSHARRHIAVRMHNALRLGGCSRREQDLQRGIQVESGLGSLGRTHQRQRRRKIFEGEPLHSRINLR